MEKLRIIKGVCIKKTALDYYGNEDRDWAVEIGKEYEFLVIKLENTEGNHSGMVIYADPINDYRPSGFVPMELFEIDLTVIPEIYQKGTNADSETVIEIKALTDEQLNPIHESFWEELYNDDKKVSKIYFEILEKLGYKASLKRQ